MQHVTALHEDSTTVDIPGSREPEPWLERRDARVYACAYVLLVALLLLPLLLVRFPLLADYPNHLARAVILHRYEAVPAYRDHFVAILEPIPNVASDVIVLLLLRVFSPEMAGRVFLVFVVVAFAFGCHVLGRAIHGRYTWLALPASLLVYSSTFLYGFVNYVLGVAVFCIAFGVWLEDRPWTVKRVLLVTALACFAYLAHLTAFGFFAIATTVIAAVRLARGAATWRPTLASLFPLVPPLVAFMAFMGGGGTIGRIRWQSLEGKIAALLAPVIGYFPLGDALVALAWAALVAAAVLGSTSLRVRRSTFAVGALFLAFFFAMPLTLLTASAVDARFVLPAYILLLLSAKVTLRPRVGASLVAAVLLLALLRVGLVAAHWQRQEEAATRQVAALSSVQPGARILPWFVPARDPQVARRERGMTQLVHYATIHRDAFVPSLFALPGQQPLVFRNPREYRPGTNRTQQLPADLLASYDYVWSHGVRGTALSTLERTCAPIVRDGPYMFCRIMRPA
jgi:hypothetical protein